MSERIKGYCYFCGREEYVDEMYEYILENGKKVSQCERCCE